MDRIPKPYESAINANPRKSLTFNPKDADIKVDCNCICLRFLGDGTGLGGVTITLHDDTTVNFADYVGYDVNDWHWYQFKKIEIDRHSSLLVEAIPVNIEG